MAINVRPLGDRVLVEPAEETPTSRGLGRMAMSQSSRLRVGKRRGRARGGRRLGQGKKKGTSQSRDQELAVRVSPRLVHVVPPILSVGIDVRPIGLPGQAPVPE